MFALFASIALVSASNVIRAHNPVHSVFFLIVVFCNAAALLILLGLDLFAMILLVVYVGAIAVLFLFVVMMLHIKLAEIQDNALRYLPVGGLLAILFLIEIFVIVDNDFLPILPSALLAPYTLYANELHSWAPIVCVGNLLYTHYCIYFLLASIILLVAMIGAIVLTLDTSQQVLRQDIYQQNAATISLKKVRIA